MKLIPIGALAVLIASAIVFGQSDSARDARYYRQQAAAAYKAKDYSTALENLKKAEQLIPDHPSIIYGIASMYARLGKEGDALAWLGKTVEMGLALHPERDEDFGALKEKAEFKEVLKRYEANTAPIVRSSPAFTLPEKGLVTEGIAYDPVDQVFYISSIHKRKILARDKSGNIKTLASEQDGLWSVLGMKVDAKRRILWATTTAFPQMVNFKKEQDGSSAVLKFDLRRGRLVKKYVVPADGKKHGLGDLVLNSAGDVIATDSSSPIIYRIRHEKDEIENWIESREFFSLQGLAFTDDERHLFVADYGKGIFDVDVSSGRVSHLNSAPGSTSLGIDGLYIYKGSLIGVQNGVNPNRLIRLTIASDMKSIQKFEVLEANNSSFDEPTLGVIVGDDLFFLANSQWGSVDDNGKLAPEEQLKEPIILRLPLR